MYDLIAENHRGEQLQLTGNRNYIVTVTGLYPPAAVVNTATVANFDGAKFNSSRVEARNIVLTIWPRPPVERNRLTLYRYFKTKQSCRLYFKTDARDVYIDGYVETFDGDVHENPQKAQISILCPNAFFIDRSGTVIDFYNSVPNLKFPFSAPAEGIPFSSIALNAEKSIVNGGDVATGAKIVLTTTGTVKTPKIYNVQTGESLILDITMLAGDRVEIDTNRGSKGVILVRDGETTNIIASLARTMRWLQLEPGDNIMTITADAFPENLKCDFIFNEKYEGL